MIPTEHMEQILDNWGVKRNKKVDVPTEQWQKSIERDASLLQDQITVVTTRTYELDKRLQKLESNKGRIAAAMEEYWTKVHPDSPMAEYYRSKYNADE